MERDLTGFNPGTPLIRSPALRGSELKVRLGEWFLHKSVKPCYFGGSGERKSPNRNLGKQFIIIKILSRILLNLRACRSYSFFGNVANLVRDPSKSTDIRSKLFYSCRFILFIKISVICMRIHWI